MRDADLSDGSVPELPLGGGSGGNSDFSMLPMSSHLAHLVSKRSLEGAGTSAIQSLPNHNVKVQHCGEESEAFWNAFFHE